MNRSFKISLARLMNELSLVPFIHWKELFPGLYDPMSFFFFSQMYGRNLWLTTVMDHSAQSRLLAAREGFCTASTTCRASARPTKINLMWCKNLHVQLISVLTIPSSKQGSLNCWIVHPKVWTHTNLSMWWVVSIKACVNPFHPAYEI